MAQVEFDDGLTTVELAYLVDGPAEDRLATGFVWLGGFMSDMTGSKAEALSALARSSRRSLLRFDYSGHGQSSGDFIDGTISEWLEQSTHMFLSHTKGRRIIVGSSMGGWLALLLAQKLQHEDPVAFNRIAGLLLIAPATDMTRELMWEKFDSHSRDRLLATGVLSLPSDYGAPYPITRQLIEDGNRHLLFKGALHLPFPVRILQGTLDRDVQPSHAARTLEHLTCDDIALLLIKGGDHRLSKPLQLQLIKDMALLMAQRADGVVT